MMNVTPMMTGIICSSRRRMYLPTPAPSHQGSGRASWTKHSVSPPQLLRRADTLTGLSRDRSSLHLDSSEVEDAEGVHLDVGDLVRPHSCRLRVPQRSRREVLGQLRLCL